MKYKNRIPVAAHRGDSKYYPENTIPAFKSALRKKADMVETDLHMTSDGELIIMHDHTVDRTTDGTGLIREKTLEQIRNLDAGSWKSAEFKGELVPTFTEFLNLFKDNEEMLFNIELKDYPADSGAFAYEAAKKAIEMMDKHNITNRSVMNTWSGELNEWLADTYGDKIRIHAYSPQERMGINQKRFVYQYAYCVCLFGVAEKPVVEKKYFDFAKAYGVEPWVYYKKEDAKIYDEALENGAMLITANDPAWVMDYLRGKGLHE